MTTQPRVRPLVASTRASAVARVPVRPRPLVAHTRLAVADKAAVLGDVVADTASAIASVSRYPLFLMFAIYALNTAERNLIAVIFPLLKDEFRLSDSALGVLSGAFVLVAALATVPFGAATDRWLRTRLMAWGTIAWSFAELWVGRATSYAMLFTSRSALGVGEASFGPASYSLVNDYYPVEDRGRALGLLQVAPLVGLGTIFLGGAIAEAWGWRAATYAYAFPGFVLAALALRLPEPRRGAMDRRAEGLEQAADAAPSRYVAMKTGAAYRSMLRIRTISSTLVGTALAFFFITGIGIWLPTFMVRYHGMSLTTAAGTVTGVALLSGGAGTYLGGVVADRLLQRGWRTSRIHVAAVTMLASALFFVPAAVVGNTAVAVITLAIGVVLAAAPVAPLLAARADVCHPDLRGRLAALQTLVLAVSSALSPALLGWLSDAYTLRFAFLALAPMMAVGGAVLWVFSPRHVIADEERMRAELRAELAR